MKRKVKGFLRIYVFFILDKTDAYTEILQRCILLKHFILSHLQHWLHVYNLALWDKKVTETSNSKINFISHSPDLAFDELVADRLAAVAVDEALCVEPLVALGVGRNRICQRRVIPWERPADRTRDRFPVQIRTQLSYESSPLSGDERKKSIGIEWNWIRERQVAPLTEDWNQNRAHVQQWIRIGRNNATRLI